MSTDVQISNFAELVEYKSFPHLEIDSSTHFFAVCYCSWFHGKISGPEAVCKLQPAKDGLFLVRESIRHPGDYVLCVSFSGDVIHYRIIYQDNKLTIDNKQHFYNLIDMVEVRHSAHCCCLWGSSS